MKKLAYKSIYLAALSALFFVGGCETDVNTNQEPISFSADIFSSVKGKKVAFQGLTNNAVSWSWNFGDGASSNQQNPVHVYSDSGYYTATLTATDEAGTTITKEVQLALDITPYVLLTGGATDEDGKTWRLSSAHSDSDYFGNADAELTPFDGAPNPLPAGIFGAGLGMAEVYEDEFTFYFDGRYEMDLKADNAAFSGLVYQFVADGGASVVNDGGADFGLCTASFSPDNNATFSYTEDSVFTVSSVYGGTVSFEGVSSLDFSESAYVGLLDFERKVMIQEINDNTMRLVMFLAASPDFIGVNTNAVILTFEVVP
ncbi:PKD domain-containing protein [Euzebyella marina]|uniref:PKD domain-containing protein n=1 Tax=Euzebyella marina TaxID=1761453 RepID=A0A3G2L8L0_9FLAO|nr:PKD domain-containing protein [Euzebyella marina]AYN68608.1 PKD domain-containing protein [Euzebyella marina]